MISGISDLLIFCALRHNVNTAAISPAEYHDPNLWVYIFNDLKAVTFFIFCLGILLWTFLRVLLQNIMMQICEFIVVVTRGRKKPILSRQRPVRVVRDTMSRTPCHGRPTKSRSEFVSIRSTGIIILDFVTDIHNHYGTHARLFLPVIPVK